MIRCVIHYSEKPYFKELSFQYRFSIKDCSMSCTADMTRCVIEIETDNMLKELEYCLASIGFKRSELGEWVWEDQPVTDLLFLKLCKLILEMWIPYIENEEYRPEDLKRKDSQTEGDKDQMTRKKLKVV